MMRDPRALPEFHRTFESGHALLGPVFLLNGQNCEVRSMDGHCDVAAPPTTGRRKRTAFFPREVFDERQFHGLMAAGNQIIQESSVVIAGRQSGISENESWQEVIRAGH